VGVVVTKTALAHPANPKFINLRGDDRFVPTDVLRSAYIHYPQSQNASAPPFVRFEANGLALEMGIVHSEVPEIARAVSSLLTRSLEDAKDDQGGHLPPRIVERVQREIISPHGVAHLWGTEGHRFVLSQQVDKSTSEVVATILVARRKGTIFFFTGRYNNVRHSTIEETVDFEQPAGTNPAEKWFAQFAFPPPIQFKPLAYHHIANFVVAKEHRNKRLSRVFLDALYARYARDRMRANGYPIEHSQYLLCGRGFWQIGDPPWLVRMERLGFELRWGAESFFVEHDWAPLPAIHDDQGRVISNLEYNRSFGLPERYQGTSPPRPSPHHLLERIPEVIRLSQDPRAKLQYFQAMYHFT
jgi:GNAT superfamily N-acetyltransferase